MSRPELKQYACALRKEGKSYSEIKALTSVSKSTLSLWLRKVELTDTQREGLIKKRTEKARGLAGMALRKKRIDSSLSIILNATDDIKNRITDPLFLMGLSLYWAEGGKTQEIISFSNSDPFMIRAIMKWLRETCLVPEHKFRIQIHIHSLHSRKDVEKYWSLLTGVPLSQFHKTYIKKTSLGHRKNILYDGTCIVRVHDSALFRKYIGWSIGFLEYLHIVNFSSAEKRVACIKSLVDKKKYKLFLTACNSLD